MPAMTTAASERVPQIGYRPSHRERIIGYDFARAMAILGMILVHASLVLPTSGGAQQPPWLAALLGLLDGRAAATFMILAGIGIALRCRSSAPAAQTRRVIFRRGLFLLSIGFLNLMIWPGDILRVYGVSFLVAAWFLDAPPRRLWLMATVFVIGFVALLFLLDYDRNWDWATLTYRHLWRPANLPRNLFYDGFRSVFPWTAFVFIGMWLGRYDLRNPGTRWVFFFGGLILFFVAELLSRAMMIEVRWHSPQLSPMLVEALFGTGSMPPLPLFLLSAGGLAVAVIAASTAIAESWKVSIPVRAVVATGQMAFTWYVFHIVVGIGGCAALGWLNKTTLPQALGGGFAFFVACAVISLLWKRFFRHGPLEGLMRAVAG